MRQPLLKGSIAHLRALVAAHAGRRPRGVSRPPSSGGARHGGVAGGQESRVAHLPPLSSDGCHLAALPRGHPSRFWAASTSGAPGRGRGIAVLIRCWNPKQACYRMPRWTARSPCAFSKHRAGSAQVDRARAFFSVHHQNTTVHATQGCKLNIACRCHCPCCCCRSPCCCSV
jgi:hypothetical protein